MKDYKRMTVGEIVADNFNNAGIFDKYGIDFCCHAISQHVKKLVDAGLIEVKKQDKFSYYYANLGVLMQYIDITKKYSIIG